ncbi:hypothetical protein [Variovorax sp.]|uniref:hypothetical protein n=1 Tax=Variovorax sp. TaxID=1871043 RepID=UPI002D6CD4EB|nr:hypothetical protein [Variovorax sp.]HYP84999.1 hypothetical protein [Variovorax sp.]
MNAIKRARHFIEQNPQERAAKVLSSLVLALETEHSFELSQLYELDLAAFELAIEILKEWRLDRYYAGKAKLFDISLQLSQMKS